MAPPRLHIRMHLPTVYHIDTELLCHIDTELLPGSPALVGSVPSGPGDSVSQPISRLAAVHHVRSEQVADGGAEHVHEAGERPECE